ncbi:MAG: hypothetical protein JKY09_02700, partial [Crocinitomicaceae bacterium]|nr:hypothetical protein [Crocinitomicaceae bacterium]
VSNGADYQYTMTYIAAVRERMAPELGMLMHDQMIPELKKISSDKGYDLVPYVHLKGNVPEKGIEVFNDLPRYAMGYASLFNSISYTLETHMLKSFPERVKATQVFIAGTIDWMSRNSEAIEQARVKALEWEKELTHYCYNFAVTEKVDSLLFKGYECSTPVSEITGLERLKYHRDQPYEKYVPYYHECRAKDSVLVPDFYVIGGQCTDVIERLRANNVRMTTLTEDTKMLLNRSQIVSFESNRTPYEGHYMHTNIKRDIAQIPIHIKKGDVLVSTDQRNRRFILSVLEPDAPDSYFVWNFFDAYLQEKEYFSSYVFEDKAFEILENNPELKAEFKKKKKSDKAFRESSWDQLYFVYKNSECFEPTYNALPVVSGSY